MNSYSVIYRLIKDKFLNDHNPIRKKFVEFMEDQCSEYSMYDDFRNQQYQPRGFEDVNNIAKSIYKLYKDVHHQILQNIALVHLSVTIFFCIKLKN